MIAAARRALLLVPIVLTLAACGGGGDGGDAHALGEEVVVQQTEASAANRSTTLGITVTKVRTGTQQELEDGGFKLDPEEETATPYYADTTIENQGSSPIGSGSSCRWRTRTELDQLDDGDQPRRSAVRPRARRTRTGISRPRQGPYALLDLPRPG